MAERRESLVCHALRSTRKIPEKDVQETLSLEFSSWTEVDESYDCIFITNPTALHYETLQQAVYHARKIFIEKPIFFSGQEDLLKLGLTPEHICYVAAPLRYTRIVQYLKEYLHGRKIFSARAICSSYLPEWRPGTDWKKCYSANQAMGGGVDIDLIHEWDYISYLFGLPERVYSLHGRYSEVTVDSCDNALYIGDYPNMSVSLHLDYFGRIACREIELFMEDDVIKADFIKGSICFLKSHTCMDMQQERDDMQRAELKYFLSLSSERDNANTIPHAMRILRLARGMKP